MSGFSQSQSSFARSIRALMHQHGVADPHLLPADDLSRACRQCYPQLAQASASVVASYYCAALRSKRFMWAVGCPLASPMKDLVGLRDKLRLLEGQLQRALRSIEALTGLN